MLALHWVALVVMAYFVKDGTSCGRDATRLGFHAVRVFVARLHFIKVFKVVLDG